MTVKIRTEANDVPADVRNDIDALGSDEPAYRAAQKTVKDWEARKKALIAKLASDVPPDQDRLARGDKFQLEMEPAAQQRTISNLPRS